MSWSKITPNQFRIKFFSYKFLNLILYGFCKDRIWVLSLKDGWTQAQKAQNNEFVESELENWVKMSWTTNKVGSNDKNRKID